MTPLRRRSKLETTQGRSDELGFLWILERLSAKPPPLPKENKQTWQTYIYYIYILMLRGGTVSGRVHALNVYHLVTNRRQSRMKGVHSALATFGDDTALYEK